MWYLEAPCGPPVAWTLHLTAQAHQGLDSPIAPETIVVVSISSRKGAGELVFSRIFLSCLYGKFAGTRSVPQASSRACRNLPNFIFLKGRRAKAPSLGADLAQSGRRLLIWAQILLAQNFGSRRVKLKIENSIHEFRAAEKYG